MHSADRVSRTNVSEIASRRRWRINLQYGFVPLLYIAAIAVTAVSALASIILEVAFVAFFALPAFAIADAERTKPTDPPSDADAELAGG
jgi:hypothetical protein